MIDPKWGDVIGVAMNEAKPLIEGIRDSGKSQGKEAWARWQKLQKDVDDTKNALLTETDQAKKEQLVQDLVLTLPARQASIVGFGVAAGESELARILDGVLAVAVKVVVFAAKAMV